MAQTTVLDGVGEPVTVARVPNTGKAVATTDALPITQPSDDASWRVEPLGQPSVARHLAVTGVTANQALTSTCRRISIRARGCPMGYAVGVGAQTADATTSHFIDQDERLDLSVPAGANIAAIAIPPWGSSSTGSGSLAITELV